MNSRFEFEFDLFSNSSTITNKMRNEIAAKKLQKTLLIEHDKD